MRILIIDDEEKLCRMFSQLLAMEGYETFTASNKENIEKSIEEGQFDIALIDILMPGISGIHLLEKIKTKFPDKKVFMLTGKLVDRALLNEVKKKGAENCLTKPITIATLVAEFQKCCHKPE